jgi:hypothetical protein
MPKPPTFLDRFDQTVVGARDILQQLVPAEELEAATADARAEFAAMEQEIPYADRPGHAMYWSSFAVFQALAVYKAAKKRGIDVHDVGRAILSAPIRVPVQAMPPQAPAGMRKDAEASLEDAAPNEFVFEIVDGDDESDWGMNIKSCAVCHAYARHDAMALVPYLCASDDKMSDADGQGLRRTGTIALGAHQCDFRFKGGGEPLPLAVQYPDRIRIER